ncbi:MAG: hypothetical protein NTW08_09240 [Gammaproteobacteria bacterium]|nr:hypothetical protein [Gammaproteobacteria bacterium]
MPSPVFNEFVQSVLDAPYQYKPRDVNDEPAPVKDTTVREHLRTLLIEKHKLQKAGNKDAELATVNEGLDMLKRAISHLVVFQHNNRTPKLHHDELFDVDNQILSANKETGETEVSFQFAAALYDEATKNVVRKHSKKVTNAALIALIAAFAGTAIAMIVFDAVIAGALTFAGGSLSLGVALESLSFLPLAFIPGGAIGILVFAAMVAATVLVLYGIGVLLAAALTTNGVDIRDELNEDMKAKSELDHESDFEYVKPLAVNYGLNDDHQLEPTAQMVLRSYQNELHSQLEEKYFAYTQEQLENARILGFEQGKKAARQQSTPFASSAAGGVLHEESHNDPAVDASSVVTPSTLVVGARRHLDVAGTVRKQQYVVSAVSKAKGSQQATLEANQMGALSAPANTGRISPQQQPPAPPIVADELFPPSAITYDAAKRSASVSPTGSTH